MKRKPNINQNQHTRRRTVHKGDSKPDLQQAYDSAVQAIRYMESLHQDYPFRGIIQTNVFVSGKPKSDADNIVKGILDSAQGIIFANDKQVRRISYDDTVF